MDPQICQAMCAIMKLSFEEEYRRAMNELGLWKPNTAAHTFFWGYVSDGCVYSCRWVAGGGRSDPPGARHVQHAERPHQCSPATLCRDGTDQPHLWRRCQQGVVSWPQLGSSLLVVMCLCCEVTWLSLTHGVGRPLGHSVHQEELPEGSGGPAGLG